jgi:hypothetical protein
LADLLSSERFGWAVCLPNFHHVHDRVLRLVGFGGIDDGDLKVQEKTRNHTTLFPTCKTTAEAAAVVVEASSAAETVVRRKWLGLCETQPLAGWRPHGSVTS